MMLKLSTEMIVQNGVVHSQPILRKQMVKGRIVGHRCGACHKASNAKVRMAKMRNEVLGYQCV